jgi:hypothetical protein
VVTGALLGWSLVAMLCAAHTLCLVLLLLLLLLL